MLAAIGAFVLVNWRSAQAGQPTTREQTHFSAEDMSVQRPVAIPRDLLTILKEDESVQHVLNDYDPRTELKEPPDSWFSASVIHLRDKDQTDFVVVGEGPLAGANMVTFWVFVATPNGYKLVLNAPAHDLEVNRRRWNHYREIEMSAETAVVFSSVLYRWDGTRYVNFRAESHEIR